MNYESVYLSKKELRRFLEIANGDTTAKNNPDEDALFRKGLVEERMLVHIDLDAKSSTVDMRAVVLTDLGKRFFAQYMNQQNKGKRDSWRFWLTTLIAIIGTILAAVELLG